MSNTTAIPADGALQRLIVLAALDRRYPDGRTRSELERDFDESAPRAIGAALRSLAAAGVLVLRDGGVRPSAATCRLEALAMICV
ncbi:MAG TPA: hypothetical protein VGL37_05330 [Solirubrobacteraceae bacterium]|jgi:hypothetical protein